MAKIFIDCGLHTHKLSKELKVWEAYYTNHPKLIKRPASLYE